MVSGKKDLLSLLELTTDEINGILLTAQQVKHQRPIADVRIFNNKSGVMIFEKPSLRTRITFETAMYELGGHPINLSADTIGLGKRETVADIARNLERWVHLIIARTFSHVTVKKLAEFSSIPVINALTDLFHPCQALAFAQTLHETIDRRTNVHAVFIGDCNNVCNSIMVLCVKLGYDFTVVCPPQYTPHPQILKECLSIAQSKGCTVTVSHDIFNAVKNATVLYTDVWTSMGQEAETERRRRDFSPYQVNRAVLSHAPADVLVSHCLPAHRGEEITSEVLDSEHSIALEEAENRLHVQKAVIVHLFS
ncbi:MAG: ornithine carbamoyltransferase [Chitinispirillaceae bacterium]|nr:ornithine carbamoyltransferase [Chitinispirillaceae bacterium]